MDRIDARRLLERPARPERTRKVSVGLARGAEEVRQAQALRWRVFVEEMGAHVPSRTPGLDCDIFDRHCEHLIAREQETGDVVGTYRILPPLAARRLGCYYSEAEFDLTRLQLLRGSIAEVGRSCVHPDYRTGAVIAQLWSGLAREAVARGYCYLAGCASVGMADGGHGAASLYHRLARTHLAPPEYRVFPRCPLPLDALDCGRAAELPPLLKGYLRLGAYLCGEPAWDPDFSTADFFVSLPVARIEARYARHFFGARSA